MKIHLLLVCVLLFLPLESLSTQESEAKAWNVNAPNFTASATTVDLDLDEGTWMSVDVSPDVTAVIIYGQFHWKANSSNRSLLKVLDC